MSAALREKVKGCIVGGAIGDALGSPVSGLSSIDIERKYGRIESLPEDLGRVTGNTLMTLALLRVYQHKRRHLDAFDWEGQMLEELSKNVWVPWLDEYAVLADVLRYPEKFPYIRLLNRTDPRKAGVGNILDFGASVYVAPIGLVNPGNPLGAYREAESFLLAHTESYALEAGCIMAAAVAEACKAGATVASITDAALNLAKDGTAACLTAVLHASERCNSPMGVEDYRKILLAIAEYMPWQNPSPADRSPRPSDLLNGHQPHRGHAIEELMVAFAVINADGRSFEQAISSAVGFGRNCGPIASMAGSIYGALTGISAVPKLLADQVLKSNNPLNICDEADIFTNILINMIKRDKDSVTNWLDALEALYPLE